MSKIQKLLNIIKNHNHKCWEENGEIKAEEAYSDGHVEIVTLELDIHAVRNWLGY